MGDDLSVPFDARARRAFGDPMPTILADLCDRLQVRHETGEVFELVPEAVDLMFSEEN